MLVDTYDGFGGLASALSEDLADEFGSKSAAVFGMTPAAFQSTVLSAKS